MAYVTIQEAQAYFDDRLHEVAWSLSNVGDQRKSLDEATRIIDTLRYKGLKNVVYQYRIDNPDVAECADKGDADSLALIRAAEVTQENEFPRDADTTIVQYIMWATYEIAYSLLDGVDPDLELENLAVSRHSIGAVRTSFNRNQEPLEHILNGIPSAKAWKWLKPFLRDGDHIRLDRVS
jgi:hypothetical protein